MEPQKKTINLISHVIFQYCTLFFLVTIMLINSSSSAATKLGNKIDHLALLEFKSQITEDPYEILSSWNESQHHCQWQGVTCGRRHQRVTSLDLHGQNLFGLISPHIGNLSFLRYIDLHMNRLDGDVPQEIGRLSRLRHLKLSNNTLEGSIPSNLTHFKELYTFDMGRNKLVGGIPEGLGSLKKLGVLNLQYNNLRGEIPKSFGNLSSLEIFSVGNNNLQGSIPNELSELRSLTIFSIEVNNLSGIVPTSLYNISSLKIIAFVSNQLTGSLPSDFGSSLPNLREFYMGINQFSRTIPASFANASRLQRFDISNNSFIGQVPNNIGRLSGLQFLNMEQNQLGGDSSQDLSFLVPLSNCTDLNIFSFAGNNLGGQLPESITNLSVQLNELVMGQNQIYGPIPKALGSLTNLYILGMDNNHLSGVIPGSFGKLKNLQELIVHGNQISGQIPSSLGNITYLSVLVLSDNRLEGNIPESLGNCQKLQYLDISNNNLVGIIPLEIIAIPSLSLILNISKNLLSGPLPAEVGRLINLNEFDISENNFSGEIPPSIGDCSSLEYLTLHSNSFQGTIPSNLASLKGIQYLDLSHNNLSGEIPKVLENLIYLQNLNLSFNDLEGEIPRKNVFGNASAISLVGNSKLCRGIPVLDKPPCPNTQVKKKNKFSNSFKLNVTIVSVVVLLTAVTSFIVLCWRRKTRKVSYVASFEKDNHMKISYRELYKATNGFSSENLIGSGSFGSVFKGNLDQRMEKLIAVKVLNLENSKASKSFVAECRILRNVRHRNLVKILTYCSSIDSSRNEFKALVYEFLPNGNLDLWLHPDEANSSRTLSLLQRVNIAIDVASALQYLHSNCQAPIVHCDLKPSNILLNDDMCACVGDFGLARFHPKVSSDILEMSSIGLKGSFGYAAPEYGIGSEVSPYGDIYSYGIILLEMMTGRRPTDDIFNDGLNLHNYVKKALVKQVSQIIDPLLDRDQQVATSEEEELGENNDEIVEMEEHGGNIGNSYPGAKCIMSILKVALACSEESPTQRMDINDVTKELYHVKSALIGHGRNRI